MALDFTVKDVIHKVTAKNGAALLKNLREVRSDFKLTAQTQEA
jgi:hypothetical protein